MAASSPSLDRLILRPPFSPEEVDSIQQELKAILASSHFRNSRRYPIFLAHIVEVSLRGKSEEIKERNIGMEAFGRSPDYDTNLDPIVRNTACEVRKRLALYYAEHETARVEIALLPGSYIPEFSVLHSQTAEVVAEPFPVQPFAVSAVTPPLLETPRAVDLSVAQPTTPARTKRHLSLLTWISWICLAVGAVLGCYAWKTMHASESFWADFFSSKHEVLIVVPEAPFPPTATGPNWARDNPDIALEDLSAIMPPTGVLLEHRVPYSVKLDPAVSLSDLIDRPVILIGGPTNKWTGTLTESLRYHLVRNDKGLYIEDSQHRSSAVCSYQTKADGSVVNDCAIIARFHSSLTGNTAMVIAGTGRNGTEAAGEWIVSPNLDARISELFPNGWKDKNIEIALKTTVIGGKNSAPTVVSAYSW